MDPGERNIVERFQAARGDPALVVLEGFHALKHAARFGAELLAVAAREDEAGARLARELAPDVASALGAARVVAPEVFARLAPRPHPTGIMAIARRPEADVSAILAESGPAPLVVLEDPRRPENVGAVVRVAAAAGAAGVVALGDSDPWHPAAVRGAAGLQFALPVARVGSLSELLAASVPAAGVAERRRLVALDPSGDRLAPGAIPPRALLVFGTERGGLSQALLTRADRVLAIPMREGVSSLNLATAVAVALYAWRFAPSQP
jgi:TrmH family RNA methyltransferase